MKRYEEEVSRITITEVQPVAVAIYPLLTEHERKKIVTDLFKEFDRLTPRTRQMIERAFQRNLKVDGFPKFMNVPLARRVDEVIRHSLLFPPAAALALRGWFERRQSIYQAISDYVTSQHKPVVWGQEPEVIEAAQERSNTGAEVGCELSYLIDTYQVDERFFELHPDMSRFDVIMAAICGETFSVEDPRNTAEQEVTVSTAIPPESSSDHTTNSHPQESKVIMARSNDDLWATWLAEAEVLPADHPAWMQLDPFIAALRTLAATKQQALAEGETLRAALAQLQTLDADLLAEMLLSPILTWQLPKPLPTPIAPVVAKLGELRTKIEEYQQVQAQLGFTRQERSAKRLRLNELEADFEEFLTQLQPLFAGDHAPISSPTHLIDVVAKPPQSPGEEGGEDCGDEPSLESVETRAEANGSEKLSEESVESFIEESRAELEHLNGAPQTDGVLDDILDGLVVEDVELRLEEEPSKDALEEVAHEEGMGKEDSDETDLPVSWDDLVQVLAEDERGQAENAQSDLPRDEEVIEPIVESGRDGAEGTTTDSSVTTEAGTEEQIAYSTRATDDDEYLWKMVEDGDLAGAYWLSRSMTKLNKVPAIPPDLLAAAQGSAWLTTENRLAYAENLREIARHFQPDPTCLEHMLLGVATALPAIILSPSSELLDWLNVPAEQDWLTEFVAPIREFGFYGVGLSSDVLPGVTDVAQLEDQLRQVVVNANEWWATAPHRRSHLKRAVDVWHDLLKPQGRLSRFMQPVLANDMAAMEGVRQELEHWQTLSYVDAVIDDVDCELSERKKPRIDGGIRDYLRRSIAEACQHAAHWLRLNEELEKRAHKGSDWLAQQAARLRSELKGSLPGVVAAMAEYRLETEPVAHRAAAQVLTNALQHLAAIFGLNKPGTGSLSQVPVALWARPPYPQWATHETDSIAQALNRRLLLMPQVDLLDDGTPAESGWRVLYGEIEVALQPIPNLFAHWLGKTDYRFIDLLFALHPERQSAEDKYLEELEGSRSALIIHLQKIQGLVEQAVVDGIISDSQRSEYLARLDGVRPQEIRNFDAEHHHLESLGNTLDEARAQRIAQLKEQWATLSDALRASLLEDDKQQVIANFLNRAVGRQDTRLVEESLAHLHKALETNQDLEIDDWFAPRQENDLFQHFLSRLAELNRFFDSGGNLRAISAAMKQHQNLAGLEFGNVPRKRLDEAMQALQAWTKLKVSLPKANQRTLLRSYVSEILVYLGFALTSSDAVRTEGVQIDDMGSDYVALSASLTHGDLARPIPQFGSQANGLYRIVCFWERPSMDSLLAYLAESSLTTVPVIALYLGRLTDRQRRELVQSTRADRLPLAILDETLLLYLGVAHNARFPIFLRCALPYATLSPYALQAGNVPPEIFYGRQDAIKQLSDQQGSCIVYGGRQLGKSALLRQVQRSFHRPDREHFAFFVDIKNIGDPHGDLKTADLWSRIRESLREAGLFKRQTTAPRPADVVRFIVNLLSERPHARLLFLLDEADNFLDADAQSRFQEVDRIRALMGETERRFRVIFAGLHNVQRFQGIPNQPLAHFGNPLPVGPLEAKAALDLVREPLQVLGFRFPDDSVPLRMLSYTNYHPSLIQLFCQELLQRLHRRKEVKSPPYYITQSDVEAVYRRPEVGDRIRERFDWTLALDPRYQIIAYALVENQFQSEESFGASYSVSEVLNLVQSWWQQGFREVDQDRLQGLLDEMVGLGILVRNRDQSYRLRSPNLVRLMGSAADIESRLIELSTRPAPTEYSADYFHALLSDANHNYQYSPLTYAQERNLTHHHSGVTLLFASDAQGYNDVPGAMKKFGRIVGEVATRVVQEIPTIISYPDQLRKELMEAWKTHNAAEQVFLYYQVKSRHDIDVYALVESAQQYCATLHTAKRCLKVIFLFGSEATWMWLTRESVRQKGIEKVTAILYPHQWDRSAICQRLEQQSKLDSSDICKLITDVTGGWPFLLDELMQRGVSEQDLRPLASTMLSELKQPKSTVASHFRIKLGLMPAAPPTVLLHFIVELLHDAQDPIDADFLTFAQSESDLALPAQHFQAALEYLVRMGCLRRQGGSFVLAPLVYQASKQS